MRSPCPSPAAGGCWCSRISAWRPAGPTRRATQARAIARPIEECRGPAVLVLAGDVFDFLRDGRPDPDAALAAHPRLAAALTTFMAGRERRVIVLPGTRDAQLAYDQRLVDSIEANGWELALACLLEIDTGCGPSVVRVEPGHRLDPGAAFANPRDPNDHPLAQHLEREVLPKIGAAGRAGTSSWLAGVEDAEPAEMGSLVASRFVYRRLFRRAAWLTLPVLALLALFFPVVVLTSRRIEFLGSRVPPVGGRVRHRARARCRCARLCHHPTSRRARGRWSGSERTRGGTTKHEARR